jgi:bifunctional non-homologous end joining protein LigD
VSSRASSRHGPGPFSSDWGRSCVDGIFLSDFEQGEIGPELFRHACLMGLEGLVSKLKDRLYRSGRSPHWVKNKNRQHQAFSRVMDTFG